MIQERLVTRWNFMRVFRVVAGALLLISAIMQKETLVGGFGLFFLYTGLLNISTSGMGGCYGNSCSNKLNAGECANEETTETTNRSH